MITCKYSTKTKTESLIFFILKSFIFILYCYCILFTVLSLGLLRDFFDVHNDINPAEYIKIFVIFFLALIIQFVLPIASFKELNWHRNAIFEIWDNKLICRYKNKETVINYSDINYMVINDRNNIDYIDSINYGSNKKMLFESFYFENKEDVDIFMPYFEITKTEPCWLLRKKVFVKIK